MVIVGCCLSILKVRENQRCALKSELCREAQCLILLHARGECKEEPPEQLYTKNELVGWVCYNSNLDYNPQFKAGLGYAHAAQPVGSDKTHGSVH
jgi:hypothetical protein